MPHEPTYIEYNPDEKKQEDDEEGKLIGEIQDLDEKIKKREQATEKQERIREYKRDRRKKKIELKYPKTVAVAKKTKRYANETKRYAREIGVGSKRSISTVLNEIKANGRPSRRSSSTRTRGRRQPARRSFSVHPPMTAPHIALAEKFRYEQTSGYVPMANRQFIRGNDSALAPQNLLGPSEERDFFGLQKNNISMDNLIGSNNKKEKRLI